MARDLIPPPSPGGRPDPESERRAFHATDRELQEALTEPEAEEATLPSGGRSTFASRFGLLTGAAIGIGIAAVALLIVVLAARPGAGPAWSEFKPTLKERELRIIQIARYVGLEYRLDDGDQMLSIDGTPLDGTDGATLRVVARTSANGEGANIDEIDGHTVLYTMKGLGPSGSIAAGTPSEARRSLTQRAALELALYTFKYVRNVDAVVTLLPPGRATATASGPTGATGATSASPTPTPTATTDPLSALSQPAGDGNLPTMLFRPGDVKSMLQQPLAATLPGETPRPSTISARVQTQFAQLALRHQFYASVVSDQLGGGILVLDRQPASADIVDALKSIEKG